MRLYEKPEMETIEFDTVDIIATSETAPDIDGGKQEFPNSWTTNATAENGSIVVGW